MASFASRYGPVCLTVSADGSVGVVETTYRSPGVRQERSKTAEKTASSSAVTCSYASSCPDWLEDDSEGRSAGPAGRPKRPTSKATEAIASAAERIAILNPRANAGLLLGVHD